MKYYRMISAEEAKAAFERGKEILFSNVAAPAARDLFLADKTMGTYNYCKKSYINGWRNGNPTPIFYFIEGEVPTVNITSNGDGSHCGLTDLYLDVEKKLRELILSGKDFQTERCGSKNELCSAQYTRAGGVLSVAVHSWIDELYGEGNLIYDALWDLPHEISALSDKTIEAIQNVAMECGIKDEVDTSENLPEGATFEDVMAAVERIEKENDQLLSDMFAMLENIVADFIAKEKK